MKSLVDNKVTKELLNLIGATLWSDLYTLYNIKGVYCEHVNDKFHLYFLADNILDTLQLIFWCNLCDAAKIIDVEPSLLHHIQPNSISFSNLEKLWYYEKEK
jgi:hypothetical protein